MMKIRLHVRATGSEGVISNVVLGRGGEGHACDDLATSTPTVVCSFDDSSCKEIRPRKRGGESLAYADLGFVSEHHGPSRFRVPL